MSKSTLTSFSTGIVSPEMASSSDTDKIRDGVLVCNNMIVDPLGGLKNRPGTQYVNDCFDTSKLSRYITFEFNNEQAYIFEFSDYRMQVLKDGALVIRDLVDVPFRWTLSTGGGTTEYFHEFAGGGDAHTLDPSFVLEDGEKMTRGTLGSLSPGEWDHGDIDALGFTTVYVRLLDSTDPDSKAQGYVQIPISSTTPYSEAEVQALEFTQSADTLYLFHPDHRIWKVLRTSALTFPLFEFPDIDGPYKPRASGDELIRIQASKQSSDPLDKEWRFTANTSLFGDAELGEPFRLGLQIPGDTEAIHWSWFVVSTLTSDTVIKALHQGTGVGDERVAYQQLLNPFFDSGLGSWQDISTGSLGEVTYSFTNNTAVLDELADGQPTVMEQAIIAFPNKKHRISVDVNSISGATPTVVVKIGTTSGAGDIFTSGPMTVATLHKFVFTPTQELVYVNLTTAGSTDGDSIEIAGIEVFSLGDDPSSGEIYTTRDWRLAAWNSTHGWPRKGIINEQRLIAANNTAEPQTIWPSRTGDHESFEFNTPTRSTDSFSFFPSTDEINGIRWLLLQNGLRVGTSESIWRVFAASGGALTPTDVNIDYDNALGSLDLKPLKIGNSLLVTPRGFTAVSEITSSFEVSGYVPRDLTIIANSLFEGRRIIKWAYAKNPDSIVWCVLDDGKLLGMTYDRQYDLWAWHTHESPLGEGYKDVAVIPNSSDDNDDDVYFIINRAEVGEAPKYYIETLNKRITPQTAAFGLSASGSPHDYKFLDSAVTNDDPRVITGATQADPVVITSTAHGYSDGDLVRMQNFIGYLNFKGIHVKGMLELNNNVYKVANKTANDYELNDVDDKDIDGTGFKAYLAGGESRLMETTITGLEHLEGETVSALADGAVEEGLVVTGGSVTLSQTASFRHAGIPYISEVETLDLEIVFETGSTQGKLKALTKLDMYFKNSRGCKVQPSSTFNANTWWSFKFKDESDGEQPPALATGVKELPAPGRFKKQERVRFRNVGPLPLHVKRIIPDVEYRR